MKHKFDNIIDGFSSWKVPYRFIVGCYVKWDKTQISFNDLYIVDNPAIAYNVFCEKKNNDKSSIRQYTYEWFLQDSFGKNALSFCKQKAEQK